MRFFRPEIERTLKLIMTLVFLGLIVLPASWGYEQRRQALRWQNIACAYRISEVARRSPIVTAGVRYDGDSCSVLRRLGLDIPAPGLVSTSGVQ